jgi:hypothetical protein
MCNHVEGLYKYFGCQNKLDDGRTTVVLVEPRNGSMKTE